jgi:hypothetical protein
MGDRGHPERSFSLGLAAPIAEEMIARENGLAVLEAV